MAPIITESLTHLLCLITRHHTSYKAPAANPWVARSATHRLVSSGTASAWRRPARRAAKA
jgi:hypothetical protein